MSAFCPSPAGLGVLSHTLTPRMKASHIALQTMRGHLDAVYDITVAYEGSLDASRQRKPAPSMPGKRKGTQTLYSLLHPHVVKPGSRHIFFWGPLSVEAVCHPVLVSLVSSKHFCPFMTPFLLFYFAVRWQRHAQKQPVIMAAPLRIAPLCIAPLFAFQLRRARKQVRVAAQNTAKHSCRRPCVRSVGTRTLSSSISCYFICCSRGLKKKLSRLN